MWHGIGLVWYFIHKCALVHVIRSQKHNMTFCHCEIVLGKYHNMVSQRSKLDRLAIIIRNSCLVSQKILIWSRMSRGWFEQDCSQNTYLGIWYYNQLCWKSLDHQCFHFELGQFLELESFHRSNLIWLDREMLYRLKMDRTRSTYYFSGIQS